MARRLRFIPQGGALVEVTCRTVQSRFLLRPSPELNDIVVGILGRAQRLYGVAVIAAVVLSTHYHLLVWVDDAKQLADFMRHVNANLALEVQRLTGWRHGIWARRYQAIVISQEDGAQIERLRYVLAHGVKEGLVVRVTEWPGVHSAAALLAGLSLQGTWFDRTAEYNARQRGEAFGKRDFATTETLHFAPLPCWAHLSSESYRERIAELIAEIEAEAAARLSHSGAQPLGVRAILRQKPTDQPVKTKRSPAPLFHAFSRRVRKELYQAYGWFAAAFREAAERLKGGDRSVRFPIGSFPPHLPFVRDLPLVFVPAG
jgi:hypothetical protein